MVIEKVKQLDEAHARQLLTWLQGQETRSGAGPGNRRGDGDARFSPGAFGPSLALRRLDG